GLRRATIEENGYFVAEAEVLGPLPYVESEFRFAFAGVAAVKADDAIFEVQSAESRLQWLLVVHHQVEPAVDDLRLGRTGQTLSVRAFRFQPAGDTRFVVNFHQK